MTKLELEILCTNVYKYVYVYQFYNKHAKIIIWWFRGASHWNGPEKGGGGRR